MNERPAHPPADSRAAGREREVSAVVFDLGGVLIETGRELPAQHVESAERLGLRTRRFVSPEQLERDLRDLGLFPGSGHHAN